MARSCHPALTGRKRGGEESGSGWFSAGFGPRYRLRPGCTCGCFRVTRLVSCISCIRALRPETPVPSPYRALFAAPGSKGFAAAGFVGRMPLSMMGIGVVTMISQLTGRYGLAGMLSATIALAAAAIGPQVSRLVDLHGQRRVLRPATLVALVASAGMLLAAHFEWPDWVLFVCAVGIGSVPSLGAMVRARGAGGSRSLPQRHPP